MEFLSNLLWNQRRSGTAIISVGGAQNIMFNNTIDSLDKDNKYFGWKAALKERERRKTVFGYLQPSSL